MMPLVPQEMLAKNDCILWAKCLTKGYGQFRRSKKIVYAHRVAYEERFGPIPAGMFVCHKCDNPACVNPDHLFLGTRLENIDDRDRKLRFHSKLSKSDIEGIRKLSQQGVLQDAVAEKYSITQGAVSRIVNRKTWRYVE